MSHSNVFDITTPTDDNFAGDGDDKIRQNQIDLKERLELDHYMDGEVLTTLPNADGYHKKVTLKALSADPLIVNETIGTIIITNDTPAVFTHDTHGLSMGDRVSFTTTGSLPSGLTVGQHYWVVTIDANTFNLSTSYDNAIALDELIATSSAGSGTHTMVKYAVGYGILYTKVVEGVTELFYVDAERGIVNQLTSNGAMNMNKLQASLDANFKDIPNIAGYFHDDLMYTCVVPWSYNTTVITKTLVITFLTKVTFKSLIIINVPTETAEYELYPGTYTLEENVPYDYFSSPISRTIVIKLDGVTLYTINAQNADPNTLLTYYDPQLKMYLKKTLFGGETAEDSFTIS